jgi:hypothetical protein
VNIEIDFDVFKQLTAARQSEADTYNNVLRRMLKLPFPNEANADIGKSAGGDWIVQGVTFPSGTELQRRYKGTNYLGRVEDGCLVVDGKKYNSPSMAAVAICGHNVNGWRFWKARKPGEAEWKWLEHFRQLESSN